MCDDSEAEFEAWLEHEWGLEGFGRWAKLQQLVARGMDKSSRCSARFPIAEWCRSLGAKRNKLETFLESLQNQRQISFARSGDILEIAIPNLLKKRDEYTARSGVAQEMFSFVSGVATDPSRASESVSVDSLTTREESPKERTTSRARGTRQRSEFPEDYQPSPDLVAKAVEELGISEAEVRARIGRCVRHHRAKGNAFKRHDEAVWNWLTERFIDPRSRGQPEGPSRPPITPAPRKDE